VEEKQPDDVSSLETSSLASLSRRRCKMESTESFVGAQTVYPQIEFNEERCNSSRTEMEYTPGFGETTGPESYPFEMRSVSVQNSNRTTRRRKQSSFMRSRDGSRHRPEQAHKGNASKITEFTSGEGNVTRAFQEMSQGSAHRRLSYFGRGKETQRQSDVYLPNSFNNRSEVVRVNEEKTNMAPKVFLLKTFNPFKNIFVRKGALKEDPNRHEARLNRFKHMTENSSHLETVNTSRGMSENPRHLTCGEFDGHRQSRLRRMSYLGEQNTMMS